MVGDHLSMGTELVGDRIGWGPFVQRDQLIGDQMWGTKCPGTICVWDEMCHSLLTVFKYDPAALYKVRKFESAAPGQLPQFILFGTKARGMSETIKSSKLLPNATIAYFDT